MRAVLVAGTHDWSDDHNGWYSPGSPFSSLLRLKGIEPVFADERSFVWSTGLGGVGFGNSDLAVWEAAGINLLAYCVPPLCPQHRIAPDELLVITHSHGLQVALFAFAHGLKGCLIDVSGPVRKDMEPVARLAAPNIAHWLHLHSDRSDRWQVLGSLFDGRFGVVRAHPMADRNDSIPGVGHSELLRDPVHYHHWLQRGWLPATRTGDPAWNA